MLRRLAIAAGSALLAALVPLPCPADDASLVRVRCRGEQRLERGAAAVDCAESGVLAGPDGTLVPYGTSARADPVAARLTVEAIGGAIRDVGSAPSETSAVLRTTIRFDNDGAHERAARIVLEVHYEFTGYGAAGLGVRLRASAGGPPARAHQIYQRLAYRGLSGVLAATGERRGPVSGVREGRNPSAATVRLAATVALAPGTSRILVRSDLDAHSLGNLVLVEPTIVATARATASLLVIAPCGLRVGGAGGRMLAPASGRTRGAGSEDGCSRTFRVGTPGP